MKTERWACSMPLARCIAMIDGIAVIEIAGTLVHRGAWIGQSSGLTSYEGIAAQLQAAVADPGVRGIALDIDSFGGEVAGAFDLADRIRAARAQKPVHAFIAEHALSAGYVLASQADRIVLPRTRAVGSIGVVALHTDMSGALDQKGIAVTLIHAGAHKVDANPYQPLPDTVHDQMQRELEVVRFLFAEMRHGTRQLSGERTRHSAWHPATGLVLRRHVASFYSAVDNPEQIASARRGYEDWWQALDWVRDGLLAGGMLREVELTEAMPKLRPWLSSQLGAIQR